MTKPSPVVSDDRALIEMFDPVLDSDKLMLDGIDVQEPWFSVGEVARFFFARSPHWIRWREEKNFFTLDGHRVGVTRTHEGDGTKLREHTQRRYSLADVEKMAHALAQKGAIGTAQLRIALHLVRIEARLWEYLP